MPVGVDTKRFLLEGNDAAIKHISRSILFFARMAPSKKPEVLINALAILKEKKIEFTAHFYGSPLPADEGYYLSLKKMVSEFEMDGIVTFYAGVPNSQAARIFSEHEIFVNCSQSGMFDKTLFEASASGCLVIAASEDFKDLAGSDTYFDGTSESLAERLEAMLALSEETQREESKKFIHIAENQSLRMLMDKLVYTLSS